MVSSSGYVLANGLHGRGEVKNGRRRRVFDGRARHARRGTRGGDGRHWGRHDRIARLEILQLRMLRVGLICLWGSRTGRWSELHWREVLVQHIEFQLDSWKTRRGFSFLSLLLHLSNSVNRDDAISAAGRWTNS